MLIGKTGKYNNGSNISKLIRQLENIDFCPKCGNILHYVNALETEAKLFFVWCSECEYVKEVIIKCR